MIPHFRYRISSFDNQKIRADDLSSQDRFAALVPEDGQAGAIAIHYPKNPAGATVGDDDLLRSRVWIRLIRCSKECGMSSNGFTAKFLRFIGIVLMGLTAGFTLLGGIGTSYVALNPMVLARAWQSWHHSSGCMSCSFCLGPHSG